MTYRIFDWNRVGPDGKGRQLHVDKAGDVLNYAAGTTAQTVHLTYDVDGVRSEAYIADPRFVVERINLSGARGTLRPDGEPVIVMTQDGTMTLRTGGASTRLDRWTTALIPAEIDSVEVAGDAALSVTPNREVFVRRLERAGVTSAQRDAFLKQFGATPAGV